MTLGEFFQSQMGAAGKWNCSTMPADWCIALGHPDFAADWRDVTDSDDCEAAPRDAGGLVALWDQGIGDALPAVDDPQAGDIAVIAALGLETGAIFTGDKWAIRRPRGLYFAPADHVVPVKVWRP
jgi:hypothetical protein